jgi:hypothetical protein
MSEPIRDTETAVRELGALPVPTGSASLTPELRATIAAQLGGARPASAGLVASLATAVRDVREHEHPKWEDLYCLNLTSYMGERMGPVLRRLLDAEARAERYRIAWGTARTRAISTGGAADRYAARARDAQEALQHMLFTVIAGQMALKVATDEAADLRARITELEASPLGWARLLDAKSLDNFMCALGMAADTDPADGALSQVEEMIRSFREAVPAGAEGERTRTLHEHIIARDAEIEQLRARLAEYERPADEDPIRYTLTEKQCGADLGPGYRCQRPAGHDGDCEPTPDAEDDVTPQVAKLRSILAGQRQAQVGDR